MRYKTNQTGASRAYKPQAKDQNMSVGVAVASTKEPRTFSIGPVKLQYFTYAAVSGDTTMTATADTMTTVFHGFLTGGFVETAATTYSGNVATFTFTDPAANRFGFVQLIGK